MSVQDCTRTESGMINGCRYVRNSQTKLIECGSFRACSRFWKLISTTCEWWTVITWSHEPIASMHYVHSSICIVHPLTHTSLLTTTQLIFSPCSPFWSGLVQLHHHDHSGSCPGSGLPPPAHHNHSLCSEGQQTKASFLYLATYSLGQIRVTRTHDVIFVLIL